MTTLRHLIATLCMMMAALTAGAQHFTGMTGLINTPSADMNRAGDVMIGGYFPVYYTHLKLPPNLEAGEIGWRVVIIVIHTMQPW